jgi:hypothetical protein
VPVKIWLADAPATVEYLVLPPAKRSEAVSAQAPENVTFAVDDWRTTGSRKGPRVRPLAFPAPSVAVAA